MKKFSITLLTILSPLLLLASEHMEVGSRIQSPAAMAQIEAQREKNGNEVLEEEILARIDANCEHQERCGFVFDRYPPVYFSSSVHVMAAISATGDSLEIEDGSVWKISSYDSYKPLQWRNTDPLLITQNNRWFSSYTYRIINKNIGTSIEANLFLGPVKGGEYTRYISAINPVEGQIILNDNTHWEVAPSDTPTSRDWALNDAVIIGYNSGWDSNYEAILINVNMNNFIRAKQY